MGLQVNDSSKQVVGGTYSGVATVKVIAINPSMDQLKAMGINATKEPEYVTVDAAKNNLKKVRLDFYLASTMPGITLSKALKASFWLENQPRTNKDGNNWEWIALNGQTAWSKVNGTPPEYAWFKKEKARNAYVGEKQGDQGGLVGLLQAWLNIDPNNQSILDNPQVLFDGNYSELLSILGVAPNNQFKVLVGVKDGKYQTVYTGHFGRFTVASYAGFTKALEGDYSAFKDDYQNDLAFKLYVGKSTTTGDSPTDLNSAPQADGKPVYTF